MPLYLRFLGPEAFGVLGFILALQAAVLALDAGLSVSVARRVAQSATDADRAETAALVRGLSRASWFVALLVGLLLAAASPFLASHWLRLGDLPQATAMYALLVASVAIALRWPLALYQGVLIGAQRLGVMSLLNILSTVITVVAAIAFAANTRDLRWVSACLAVGAGLHVMVGRHMALRWTGPVQPAGRAIVFGFLHRSADAAWLGLIGLLLMQQDKLVLSLLLPVGEFGYYVMAALVTASLYVLVTPVFNMVYPRLAHQAAADPAGLESLYRRTSLMLASFLFPPALALATFGDSLLLAWTRDPAAAESGKQVVMLLAIGSAFHGVMFMPYALKMSLGRTNLAVRIGGAVLLLSLPATWLGAWTGGAVGAAAGWLALHSGYLCGGSILTHARLLPAVTGLWLSRDIGPPFAVSFVVVGLAGVISAHAGVAAHQRLVLATLAVVACWTLLAAGSPRLRDAVRPLLAKAA